MGMFGLSSTMPNHMMPMVAQPGNSALAMQAPLQSPLASPMQTSSLTGGFASMGGSTALPATSGGSTSFNNSNFGNSELGMMTTLNMMLLQVITMMLSTMQMLMEQTLGGSLISGPPAVGSPSFGLPGFTAPVTKMPVTGGNNPPGGGTQVEDGGKSDSKPDEPKITSTIDGVKVGDPKAMQALAKKGRIAARRRNSRGRCLAGVGDALQLAGYAPTRRPSAYMAAGVLARNNDFKEIKVSRDKLDKLPPGCIIVWDKTNQQAHGHIAITQGNGRETSDHAGNLIKLKGGFRVFVPVNA